MDCKGSAFAGVQGQKPLAVLRLHSTALAVRARGIDGRRPTVSTLPSRKHTTGGEADMAKGTVRGTARGVAGLLALAVAQARAQTVPSDTTQPPSLSIPPVNIIAASPLLGSGIDRDTVPAETPVLKGNDLTRGGTL